MKKIFSLCLFLFLIQKATAQNNFKCTLIDAVTNEPLIGATVIFVEISLGNVSNDKGEIVFENIATGNYHLICSYIGYETDTIEIAIPFSENKKNIRLQPASSDLEEVIVTSTRNHSRIEETPQKIEVLGTEELNEENGIKPGNVGSILGDISGIQLQQTSASSGNTVIRIQGLGGKYTQVLRDGLPLYSGLAGSFGVLSVQPLDLKQIEIIKGSASTLYGGGAIGGLINYISKTPGQKPVFSFTLNQSTLTESNANIFYSSKGRKAGVTVFGSANHENAVDVNGDQFSDVPQFLSLNFHPRAFFYFNSKTSLAVGINSAYDNRLSGDMNVLAGNSDSLHQFQQRDYSTRNIFDFIFQSQADSGNELTVKGALSQFNQHEKIFSTTAAANQFNGFSEISYFIAGKKDDLVTGVNAQFESHQILSKAEMNLDDYTYSVAGVFLQNTFRLGKQLVTEEGLRVDYHSRFKFFVLPRFSVLYKINSHFALRSGIGLGYRAPDAFAENDGELKNTISIPSNLVGEKSTGGNFELNFKTTIGSNVSVFLNEALFYTQVNAPVISYVDTSGIISYRNAERPLYSRGSDSYARVVISNLEIYLGYTYTDTRQLFDSVLKQIPLTPKNRFASVLVYELNEHWKIGIESSYTGKQLLYDQSMSRGYLFGAAMISYHLKKSTLVLNCENVLDERQTRYESIVLPPTSNPTFKPLWGPIDGRVINLSWTMRF